MKEMIERYINKMSINDVINFANKKNVNLSSSEAEFTFQFIKKNYKQILSNPNLLDMNRYKSHYSEENFKKINKIFNEYYSKYHHLFF